jgi:hypothetical protein
VISAAISGALSTLIPLKPIISIWPVLMERLSGGCAAEAGREKDKKKSKHAAISEVFIMVENVAML